MLKVGQTLVELFPYGFINLYIRGLFLENYGSVQYFIPNIKNTIVNIRIIYPNNKKIKNQSLIFSLTQRVGYYFRERKVNSLYSIFFRFTPLL